MTIADPLLPPCPPRSGDDVPVPRWIVVSILNGPGDPWYPQALHGLDRALADHERAGRSYRENIEGWRRDMADSD